MGFAQLGAMDAGEQALSLQIRTWRKYRQNPTSVEYRGPMPAAPDSAIVPADPDSFSVGWNDGYFIIPATMCNRRAWFPPAPAPGCGKGASAYLIFGDIVNRDGSRNDYMNRYWEMTSIVPAAFISPYHPELCTLWAAPPSLLARPQTLFGDNSVSAFWNINTETTKQYDVTNYFYALNYATRYDMDNAIVPGVYDFLFPKLRQPIVPVKVPSVLQRIPEGSIVNGKVRQGVRVTKMNGKPLNWTSDGYVLFDPRLINTFQWEGNDVGEIFPTDRLYFGILNYIAINPTPNLPPLSPERREVPPKTTGMGNSTLFPGFVAPGTPWVLMPTPLQKSFTMPGGIIDLFVWIDVTDPVTGVVTRVNTNVITEGVLELTLLRSVWSSTIARDTSQRRFQMPVRCVDTYEGWATFAFDYGTSDADKLPGADPDHDGYTNYQEWKNGTLPQKVNAHQTPSTLSFVQGSAVRSTDTSTDGHWETKMGKFPGSSLPSTLSTPVTTYEYEFSSDMQNWRSIQAGDPDWELIETADEIKVQSRSAVLTGAGFLRVKTTYPDSPPVAQ